MSTKIRKSSQMKNPLHTHNTMILFVVQSVGLSVNVQGAENVQIVKPRNISRYLKAIKLLSQVTLARPGLCSGRPIRIYFVKTDRTATPSTANAQIVQGDLQNVREKPWDVA